MPQSSATDVPQNLAMDSHAAMNAEQRLVLDRLQDRFGAASALGDLVAPAAASCPVGIEVEVKWRDYFPDLYERYLKDRRYRDLDAGEQAQLTAECSALEADLLPRLQATVDCGVARGADKYWEFAFGPTTEMAVLAGQVRVLQQANLIPSGEHSLHMTIGQLGLSRDSYYLALLLEMMASSPQRIAAGFHQDQPSLSAGWARKGMGGVFLKDAADLQYGATQAIELRTLQLTDQLDVQGLLSVASGCADVIHAKKNGLAHRGIERWEQFVNIAGARLAAEGLADANWKKPNMEAQCWQRYIDRFSALRSALLPAYGILLAPMLHAGHAPVAPPVWEVAQGDHRGARSPSAAMRGPR